MARTPLLSSDLVRRAVTARLPRALSSAARTTIDLFRGELDEYAEIISTPAGSPIGRVSGFMTRGEGPSFSERARVVVTNAGAEGSVVSDLQSLAAWCEHKNAYFKVEWHPHGEAPADGGDEDDDAGDDDDDDGDGADRRGAPVAYDMVMATYFRRRRPLAALQTYLYEQGIPALSLAHLGELAQILEKQTPHFISMALRPGFGAQYKIYFSQHVTAETAPAVRARVWRALETLATSPAALASWDAHHDSTLPQQLAAVAPDELVPPGAAAATEPAESTIFLSVSLTSEGLVPGIKIDYPEVTPHAVARWAAAPGVSAEAAAQIGLAGLAAAQEVGKRELSYLGVRFSPHVAAPLLKFYADRAVLRDD